MLREEALDAKRLVGLVKADRDALQGLGSRHAFADEQNGTMRVRHDVVRDGAEKQAVKRALAVRAHHDHVGRKLVAGGNNGLDGRADAVVERHAGGKRAAAVNDGVEDGLRLLAVELVKGVRVRRKADAVRSGLLRVENVDLGILAEESGLARRPEGGVLAAFGRVDGNKNLHFWSSSEVLLDAGSVGTVGTKGRRRITPLCPLSYRKNRTFGRKNRHIPPI